MSLDPPISIFYEESDPDRWLAFDRYPRRWLRRFLRGAPQVGGVKRWFINLCSGLDQLSIPYEINNYRRLKNDPNTVAFVIGREIALERIPSHTRIVFGPGVPSHPSLIHPDKIKQIEWWILPCDWFCNLYKQALYIRTNEKFFVWPAGIDTDYWRDSPPQTPGKILLYNKVRWEYEYFESELIKPIRDAVRFQNRSLCEIRYGYYQEEHYRRLLKNVDAMIFLCEHETQGFAYMQALASNVPVFAWNRRGILKDPTLFPSLITYSPVSSVPYFDERCGLEFTDKRDFDRQFANFLAKVDSGQFRPRDYILDNFTLAMRAKYFHSIAVKIRELVD